MRAPLLYRALAVIVLGLALGLPGAQAKDRPFDRDWRTGVTVAPGAMTWTDDNLQQKEALIRDIATARGKTCTHYAFLGWPPGSGGGSATFRRHARTTRRPGTPSRKSRGTLPPTPSGPSPTGPRGRILWGGVAGSTIYMACLTVGDRHPAPRSLSTSACFWRLASPVCSAGCG